MFGSYNVGLVATNPHMHRKICLIQMIKLVDKDLSYASSIVVAMRKLKLKEDEDGNKTTDVKGIRAACKVMKTRSQ